MKVIELDIGRIKDLVTPILEKLVNQDQDAAFDQIGKPLSELETRIPGVSDLAGVSSLSYYWSSLLKLHGLTILQ